jgi:hypothetical protein
MTTLEHKVETLVALEAIRRVIALYAKAGDDNNNPAALAPLLDENARWVCAGFGDFTGRETITQALARVGRERILWSLHYPVAPIIDLADDLRSAHAFWWLWELTTMRDEAGTEENNWLGATYECDFVRAADAWKISYLVLDIKKIVPYANASPPL